MRYMILITAFLAVVLAGCATPLQQNQVRVTFMSEPPGAMIYDGSKAWGVAPVELVYTGSPTDVQRGYLVANNAYAVWASGARSPVGVRLGIGKGDQGFTFSRPPNAPGFDKDLAFAAKLRQVAAQEDAADAAVSAAMWQSFNSNKPIYTDCSKLGSNISCVSR